MSVTDSMIRPALSVVDLQKTIEGGAKSNFAVPAISVKRACEAVGNTTTAAQQRAIKTKFENVMCDALRKASKKNTGDLLSLTSLQAVLEQKQYQKLFKR
jgi:ribosomal protein S7